MTYWEKIKKESDRLDAYDFTPVLEKLLESPNDITDNTLYDMCIDEVLGSDDNLYFDNYELIQYLQNRYKNQYNLSTVDHLITYVQIKKKKENSEK